MNLLPISPLRPEIGNRAAQPRLGSACTFSSHFCRFLLGFAAKTTAVFALLLLYGCNPSPSTLPGGEATQISSLKPLTNMVLVKAGSFLRIRHPVTLTHDFWIGKYEVTQGEYVSLMSKNPSRFSGEDNRPVEKLSWFEAMAYCNELTKQEQGKGHLAPGFVYRLPTEAEWEYACRAGSTNHFSFGDSSAGADQFAWTMENSENTSHPVGQKRPNALGLYDMHGNVWEWCHDWFSPYPAMALTDPTGATSNKFKVFRGGGWNQAVEFARASNRFMMAPSNGIHFVGFRVALGHPLPPPQDPSH
jgi:formylglycine-generating enzyme required for sulfatase activity